MSLTILLAGGTGLIGARLSKLLRANGYQVRLLSRTPRGSDQYAWDPVEGRIDDKAVEGVDIVINLAGAGIADQRWTAARKKLIIDSRVQSAKVLREAFQRLEQPPKAYLSASAIGYYGNAGENWCYESDPPVGDGFLVQSCAAWEQAVEAVGAMGIRTVVFRIGIVLDRAGGALPKIALPLRFGAGTYFGNGQAWYSWIHPDDLCQMFLWAIEHPNVEGIFNAVAPHPARNIDLVKAIAKARRSPAIFVPAPEFALRLALGEMADAVLFSNRVSADKIIHAGFHFRYPNLETALHEIFNTKP